MRISRSALRITATAALVLAPLAVTGPAASASARLPVGYDFAAGVALTAAAPATPPPGANDWNCRPSAAHLRPVVLIHGSLANMDDDWQTAAPVLANHGYCVFAFNYGGSPASPVQGTGDIAAGARTLAAFVDRVRAATGAARVDLVSHSTGGAPSRYYINFLGGAATVDRFVAIVPVNRGTTFHGFVSLADALGARNLVNGVYGIGCEACVEQEEGSAFLARLNRRPTVPGVTYTVIATKDDETVTPYTNAFLPAAPNVTNITVQNQCRLDASDHAEIASDPVAMADMLNGLDPARPVRVPCVPVAPLTGPPGPVPSF